MRSLISIARRAGWALLCLVILAPAAHAAVGRTPGNFAVSPTGAATYSMPIWAPAGPNGLQPQISLLYNSQQPNGIVGTGWGLAGLSVISRCNRTFAQDGVPGAIALASTDGLCLDGKRLRLTSGTYGQAGSSYQTEVADFSNVTAYGTAGNGPAYFIVKDRDGRTYEYGVAGSSQVLASGMSTPLSWLLCKVSDAAGNTETISYTPGTGSAVPHVISWAPSTYGASTYQYTMTFNYKNTGSDPVPLSGNVAGTPVQVQSLLTSITIASNGTSGTTGTLKNYVLSYQTAPVTGRNILTQVSECADVGATNCLWPTSFSYQGGSMGVSSTANTVATNLGVFLGVYDFDGDGRDDMLYADTSNSLYVSFGSPTGFGAPVAAGIKLLRQSYGSTSPYPFTVAGDVHGSGRASILTVVSGAWWEYAWNGTSFAGTNTGLNVDTSTEAVAALADVDGDGLLDLVTASASRTALTMYVRLNTSQGGSLFSSTRTTAYSDATKACPVNACGLRIQTRESNTSRPLDFDGDGRGDIALLLNYESCLSQCRGYLSGESILLSRGGGFVSAPAALSSATNTYTTYLADVNDDGCTDVVVDGIVYISGCDGGSPQQLQLGVNVLAALDWNGDGRTDLVVANGTTLGVYVSTGTGFNLVSTSIPYNGSQAYFATSPVGDGLNALSYWTSSSALGYYLHNGAGQPSDLLMKVTDGYGNSVSPTYVSIVQALNSVYFTSTNVAYPYQNYQGPLYVVSQATFSDPYGTTVSANGVQINGYQKNYYYGYGRTNLQGRGFAGFANVQEHDSRNGVWLTRIYGQEFPYAGIYQGEVATQNNSPSTSLWTANVAPTFTVLSSATNQERYFVWTSSVTRQDYELGASQNRVVKTTSTTSNYDDYGNPTRVSTTVTDNDSGSPYYGVSWTTTVTNTPDVDTSNWCLDLYTQTQVAYTSTDGGAAVTRTKGFTPDTAHCRYTQIVTEPNNASYRTTEVLGYDSFGNLNSDSIAGANMATRTTTTYWGTTGQFPVTTTNPLSQPVTLGYDFGLGLPTSRTDANGLVTSWTYDSFGRKTRETRPDGTATTFTLNDCAPLNDCNQYQRTLLGVAQLDKNGATIRAGDINLDSLNRPHQVWRKTLNPVASTLYTMVQTNYDTLGRVASQSFPSLTAATQYFTTTAYDVRNRPVQVSRPTSAGNSTPAITQYLYAGDSTTITDANGHAKTLVNDPIGRLRHTTDATGYSIIQGYDAAGGQTSVTDSLGNTLATTTWQYGVRPMAVSRMDADLGASSYTYDALGEVTSWLDAKNQHFTLVYDALGRQTDRYEPDLYTHFIWGVNAAAHEIGQLASVCTGTGANPAVCTATGYAESETYDNLGRPATRAIQIPGDTTYTYAWGYDPTTGQISTITYPADSSGYRLQLQYGYSYGLLSSITDTNSSDPTGSNGLLWSAAADNERLQLTQEVLGNKIVVNHSFDPVTGLFSSITAGVPSAAALLQNNSYLFDAVGNLIQRQDNITAVTENVYVDALNRLDHTVGDTSTKLTYDAMGRLSGWGVGGVASNVTDYTSTQTGCSYYSNAQPHAVRKNTAGNHWTSICYDANGNETQQSDNYTANDLLAYTWTSYNQPALITQNNWNASSGFFYDHNHQRWKQIASYGGSPEITEYIGVQMQKMQNATNTFYRYYVTAGNNTIVMRRTQGSSATVAYYLTTDHLGSTALVTDQNGAPVAHEKFSALGWTETSAADQATMASITRQEFTGQENLDNLGLLNLNNRLYWPSGSRFVSPDPTEVHDRTNTIDYNRYAYAAYNPLRFKDPSGYEEIDDGGAGGAGGDGGGGGGGGGGGDGGGGGGGDGGGDGGGGGDTGGGNTGGGDTGGNSSDGGNSNNNNGNNNNNNNNNNDQTCTNADGSICTVTVPGHNPPPNLPDPGLPVPFYDVPFIAPLPGGPLTGRLAGVLNQSPPRLQLPAPWWRIFCVSTFQYSGREIDGVEAGGFLGGIHESTNGYEEYSQLIEFWLGGEGGTLGAALTHNPTTHQNSGFGFGGVGIDAGPLAGVQVGVYLDDGGDGIGFYAEGHEGLAAHGSGVGVTTSCN